MDVVATTVSDRLSYRSVNALQGSTMMTVGLQKPSDDPVIWESSVFSQFELVTRVTGQAWDCHPWSIIVRSDLNIRELKALPPFARERVHSFRLNASLTVSSLHRW